VGTAAAIALLLAALPPTTLQPGTWTLLPGWAYGADGLSVGLAALLLLLAGTALVQVVLAAPEPPGWGRQGAGWTLLLLALAQTVFAAQLAGRWLGLEGAGLALWLLAPGTPRPILLLRHLAGYPLLAVALSGLLDARPAPGQVVAALPAWVVLGLLLSALVRLATVSTPVQNPQSAQPRILYAAVALYPLIRSLTAGPWDSWGRFTVVAVALALLGGATAYCVVRVAYPHYRSTNTSDLLSRTSYLAGAVLLGLGIGSAAGVHGALALGVAGLGGCVVHAGATGLAGQDGTALRRLGLLSVAGLPPFAGFAGLWLLAGALLPARYPLGLVLLLAGAGLLAWDGLSQGTDHPSASRIRPAALPLLPLAALLLFGGLAPAAWLDGLIRPAADALAAGVPALSSVIPVPGLGYTAGPETQPLAAWPILGLGVAVALAWLVLEGGARLLRRLRSTPHSPTPNPRP
jgi:hypothetical protein